MLPIYSKHIVAVRVFFKYLTWQTCIRQMKPTTLTPAENAGVKAGRLGQSSLTYSQRHCVHSNLVLAFSLSLSKVLHLVQTIVYHKPWKQIMLFQQHQPKIKTKGTAVLGYMLSLDSIRTIKQYVIILSPKNQMLQVIYWTKSWTKSADRYLIWICDPRLERLLKRLLNVSDVLHPVKLLTLLGFFQCAFVTTAALKWFSWYPAIVNIPQSGVPQLGEMFWLDLLQQLWLKLALVLLHLCQITDRWRCPNMTPER